MIISPKYFLWVVLFFFPLKVMAAPPIPESSPVNAAAAIIYDMDNEAVLFEHHADDPIPPASLTKIMSMFLAFDHIQNGFADLDSQALISREAAGTGGSLMGISAGETIPLKKLLLGMAVSSGNDASHAVAEYVGGSVDAFVKQMNAKAAELGMSNSHFENPHGLPANGQFTTARDMLILARAYLKTHPDVLNFHNTLTLEHNGYKTWNKNPLLGQYKGADGLKTGWIRASGHNLVFTATRDGRRLLGVILGAADATTRGAEACRLLDAGFIVCSNGAVSIAAALEDIPLDLKSIDISKTPRNAGLLKPRYMKYRSKIATLNKADIKRMQMAKARKKTLAKNIKKNKMPQKAAKATAKANPKNIKNIKKSAAKKSGSKAHAAKKNGSAKRS